MEIWSHAGRFQLFSCVRRCSMYEPVSLIPQASPVIFSFGPETTRAGFEPELSLGFVDRLYQ